MPEDYYDVQISLRMKFTAKGATKLTYKPTVNGKALPGATVATLDEMCTRIVALIKALPK